MLGALIGKTDPDNSSKDLAQALMDDPGELSALEPEDITRQLANLSLLHINICEDEVDLSTMAALRIEELDATVDHMVNKDRREAAIQASIELKKRLALAKVIIAPELQLDERNDWFKAIGLASLACQGLGRDKIEGLEIRSTQRVGKLYLRTMAGLMSYYANKNKIPDWDLLSQLLLDAYEAAQSAQERHDSMTSLLAQALARVPQGATSKLKLWRTYWEHDSPNWAAIPDIDKCPIQAFKAMLDAVGPIAKWSVEPDDDSIPSVMRMLDSTMHLMTELNWVLSKYLDLASKKTRPPYFPDVGDVDRGTALHQAKTQIMKICRQAQYWIRTREALPPYPFQPKGWC
jgi:hypothetical protein